MTRAEKNIRALQVDHLMADLGRRTASGGALAIGAQLVKIGLHVASTPSWRACWRRRILAW
jgi:hypothetical protein